MKNFLLTILVFFSLKAAATNQEPTLWIEVEASNSKERSKIVDLGFEPSEFRSDRIYFSGNETDLKVLKENGIKFRTHEFKKEWFESAPSVDDLQLEKGNNYHSYSEMSDALAKLSSSYPHIASLEVMGKTLENRDIYVLRISSKSVLDAEIEALPTAVYMGCHHAREHLSVEVPLLYAEYLLKEYGNNPVVTRLVDSREIYIAPMINPDGHIYDFKSDGGGKMWRKNRRATNGRVHGVDLNRNYGFGWGGGGASTNPNSETYRGTAAFSEPETQVVRDFVKSKPRIKTLLSFHTFSELVLYPWGHKDDPIGGDTQSEQDLAVFKKMADTMAGWNKYRPMQSSGLYIASGDTTDWAYGELGIFAFTFELTPRSMYEGGFYPGTSVIQPTFENNLKPLLYLLEYSDNPTRVLTEPTPRFSLSPTDYKIPIASFNDIRI